MTKETAIYRSMSGGISRCCSLLFTLLVMSLVAASPAHAVVTSCDRSTVTDAVSNRAYGTGCTTGVKALNNTHDFSVTVHGICRYIDVGIVPGGQGLLIPFKTPNEWIGTNTGDAMKGFIATSGRRNNFVRLDFCRLPVNMPVDYTQPGGISDPSSLAPATQQVSWVYPFVQKRVETRSDDPTFVQSLTETRSQSFNMSRMDCLVMPCSSAGIAYPDGSTRNPSYTWSWVETITSTSVDNIGMNRPQAENAAKAMPIVANSENWGTTLTRTACTGPNGVASDGRPVPSNTCPPTVQAPVLRACAPNAHNTKRWSVYSTGNVRMLPDTCPGGTVRTAPGRYVFDVEEERWCFDGTDYPTGATREVNGVTTPETCTLIVNGQVGPAGGQSFDTQAQVAAAGLCTAGTTGPMTVTATGWSWTCKGSTAGPGTDAAGTANQHMAYNLACSIADSSLSGSPATYSCDKFNSGGSTCSGTQTLTGLPGCCKTGQPNTASFSVSGFTVSGCDAPAPTCAAGWGVERIIYSEDSSPGATADMNAAGQCTEGQGGHAASTKGNISECWTKVVHGFNYDVYGRYCGNSICTQSTQTDTQPCGSGYGGNQTRTRTRDTGNICGVDGAWSAFDRSACTATCTAHTEDQTIACGSGYTGNKVQRRTADQGNVCGSNSAWVDYDTSACMPVAVTPPVGFYSLTYIVIGGGSSWEGGFHDGPNYIDPGPSNPGQAIFKYYYGGVDTPTNGANGCIDLGYTQEYGSVQIPDSAPEFNEATFRTGVTGIGAGGTNGCYGWARTVFDSGSSIVGYQYYIKP